MKSSKLDNSQSGFTPIHILLLLVIFGIIGFAGWKVYEASNSATLVDTSATESVVKKEESKIPEGFVEYKNEELGFKFAYPKEWGEVSVKQYRQECGHVINNPSIEVIGDKYTFSFSKNNEKEAYIITDDFQIKTGVVKCGFVPEVYNASQFSKNYLADGNYEYLITDNNYECSRQHYYLFGKANIKVKNAKNIYIKLHSVEDRSNNCTVENVDLVQAAKDALTKQDKDFVSSFKTL